MSITMDWDNPMAMFGLDSESQPVDDADADQDDFYGDAAAADDEEEQTAAVAEDLVDPGRRAEEQQQLQETRDIFEPPSAADIKSENLRKAELLRAKLLAQRSNTPARATAVTPRAATPSTVLPAENVHPTKTHSASVNGIPSMEALLTRGKAMADARAAALSADTASTTTPSAAPSVDAAAADSNHLSTRQTPADTRQEKGGAGHVAAHQQHEHSQPHPSTTDLADSYYADLSAWLEMTGYHDPDFRRSRLAPYRERLALEQEAARIAEKLEKLRRVEQESMHSLHFSAPKPATSMPPPLPQIMPADRFNTPRVNGVKRARSPRSLQPEKFQRRGGASGFRIRGANASPERSRSLTAHRRQSHSPIGHDRREGFHDHRAPFHRSREASRSRDPSLERRQSYYRRSGEPETFVARASPRPPYGPKGFPSPKQHNKENAPLDPHRGGQSRPPPRSL